MGLGDAVRIEYVEVLWPTSGERQRFQLAMDQAYRLVEGDPSPQRVVLQRFDLSPSGP